MNWDKYSIYTYRATATQVNAGATDCGLIFTFPARMHLIELAVGPDSYATSRGITIELKDENGNAYNLQIYSNSINNAVAGNLLAITTNAVGSGSSFTRPGITQMPYPVIHGDTLTVKLTSLAQNETVTVLLRVYTKQKPFTVTGVDSSNSIVEEYAKIA